MKINHIGYAVSKINKAIERFQALGFKTETEVIEDKDRNVNICFMSNGAYRIELVSVLDTDKKSPIDSYLRSVGDMPYHICYECKDIYMEIDNLMEQKFKVVSKPTEAVAFDKRKVAFLMANNTGLIELVEV
jgi:methylmalonyl-CoA/ethylmalonyl-CoA epimerase